MFKRFILLLIIFSPLWYSLFIGYPVISDTQHALKEKERPKISVSKRCFAVGDFKQFMECFHSERLSGITFLDEVAEKTNQMSPFITFVVFTGLTFFTLTSVMWVIKYEEF